VGKQIFLKCSVVPVDDNSHPNKSPFKGILCSINNPSVDAPNGSDGLKVQLSRDAVENSIQTLIGMPVNTNYSEDNKFDKHNTGNVIGQISKAYISNDNIMIEGFLYPQNCPKICASIKKEKQDLGFSYELLASKYEITDENVMLVTELCFTGASLLYKDKAAYGEETQLIAAQKNKKKVSDSVEAKEFEEIMTRVMAGISEEKVKKEKEVDFVKQMGELADSIAKISASIAENKTAIEEVALEVGNIKAKEVEAAKLVEASVEEVAYEDGTDYKYDAEKKAFVKIEAAKEVLDVPTPKTLQLGQKIEANKDLEASKDFQTQKDAIWADTSLTPDKKLAKIAKLK